MGRCGCPSHLAPRDLEKFSIPVDLDGLSSILRDVVVHARKYPTWYLRRFLSRTCVSQTTVLCDEKVLRFGRIVEYSNKTNFHGPCLIGFPRLSRCHSVARDSNIWIRTRCAGPSPRSHLVFTRLTPGCSRAVWLAWGAGTSRSLAASGHGYVDLILAAREPYAIPGSCRAVSTPAPTARRA